jgi:tetratricopeptide (TPR) repeat protein
VVESVEGSRGPHGTFTEQRLASNENPSPKANPEVWTSGPAAYRWIPPFLVAAITFLIYLPTLSYQFVWDDQMQIVTNPLVLSWTMVPRALESNLWFQIVATGNFYRPFFIIWSILAHSLFAFDPRGWHFLNILLHVAATVLVFVLLQELRAGYWTAVLAALFFGIHPVHVETAAWISAGADSLVTILVVLTFLAYLRFRNQPKGRGAVWLALSLLCFACALLTKEMAVIFPAMLFVYEWLVPRGPEMAGIASKLRAGALTVLPYGLLDLAYLLQRHHVLHSTLAQQSNMQTLSDQFLTLPATISTLPLVVMDYLRYLLYPFGLTGFYFVHPVYSFANAGFLLPFACLIALAGGVWYWSQREKEPLIAFFGLWLVIVLSPALYLPVFKIGDFVRDRYMYLPSIGFVFLLAEALRLAWRSAKGPALTFLLVAAISAFFLAGVTTQEGNWASDLLVFYRGYTLYPENTTAAQYLGATLNRENQPSKAEPLLREAIQADPRDPYGHFTLALVETALGQQQQAEKELSTAYALAPQYYSGSSDGLTSLGIALSALHHYPEAEQRLEQAVQLEPDAALAHFYLGLTLLRTGRAPEAEQHLRKAIGINSSIDNFHWALGLDRQLQGDAPGAEQEYRTELRLHPDNKAAATSLASLASNLQSQQIR